MARIPILGGAYRQASLIAGAQRSVNLYAERNPQTAQSPVQVTHYSRPGLTPLGTPPAPGRGRGLYVSTLGDLYAVIDQAVYWVDPNWNFTKIGTLLNPGTTPVYAADNSTDAFMVDGSTTGYVIQLQAGKPGIFGTSGDPNYLGADRADFLDYFLIFNQPNTPNWYCTLENSISFNALYFGTKTAWPDNVVGVIACERVAWVIGKYKSECWNNAGLVPFPFQILSGNIVEHGTCASYSLCKQDVNAYWLSESPEGARMFMRGVGLQAQRISTHAIEEEWLGYPRTDDCICQTYQIRGHAFVMLHFPTADRTWSFDEATQEWHEEAFYDVNGVQHRTRDTMMAYAYGKNVSLDWQTGQLYQRDETNYSDNGIPIVYKRGMPHLLDGEHFSRVTLWRVIADMECGNGTGVETPTVESPWSLGFNAGFGPRVLVTPPQVTCKCSYDRGFSFVTNGVQPLGGTGQYQTRPTWNRFGYANDFVIQLEWEGPMHTGLNGVFVETEVHEGDV